MDPSFAYREAKRALEILYRNVIASSFGTAKSEVYRLRLRDRNEISLSVDV